MLLPRGNSPFFDVDNLTDKAGSSQLFIYYIAHQSKLLFHIFMFGFDLPICFFKYALRLVVVKGTLGAIFIFLVLFLHGAGVEPGLLG